MKTRTIISQDRDDGALIKPAYKLQTDQTAFYNIYLTKVWKIMTRFIFFIIFYELLKFSTHLQKSDGSFINWLTSKSNNRFFGILIGVDFINSSKSQLSDWISQKF